MSDTNTRISKFLSLVLRHKPAEIGITLDEAGWVEVDTLLSACQKHRFPITRPQLEMVVATSDKKRFAFNEDGTRIRANQGHSVEVELGYAPAQPPEILYHGTADRFLDSIRRQGLLKGKRHHVHLSLTRETAAAVGTRHGRLVLLQVRSGDMHRAGIQFYKTPNDVWLTDTVPAEYLVFP
jgi:putative RNA 2'-phosphotransferase